MAHLTKEEKETVIVYDEQHKTAQVFTYSPKLIRKLQKKIDAGEDGFKLIRENAAEGSYCFEVPKKCVRISSITKCNLTDEQRKQRAERMRKYCHPKTHSDGEQHTDDT